jgi:hypothetical protein
VSFTVSARVSAHRFSYRHASLLSALEQGLSLLTAGVSDVQVVDGDGHARCPAAVYQALFGPRVAADLQVSALKGATQALAA